MNEENPSILPNVATDEDAGFRVRSTQPTNYCRARRAGSDRLQFAGVGDFPLADRAYLRRFKGHYGSGLAIQCRKLYLIGNTIPVHVHDGPHVTGFEPFAWHR